MVVLMVMLMVMLTVMTTMTTMTMLMANRELELLSRSFEGNRKESVSVPCCDVWTLNGATSCQMSQLMEESGRMLNVEKR